MQCVLKLLTSGTGDADPVQAAILRVCEELEDPNAFQGMIHLLAFIATGKRRVRLLLGKHQASLAAPSACWLDLLSCVIDVAPLCRTHGLVIFFCRGLFACSNAMTCLREEAHVCAAG